MSNPHRYGNGEDDQQVNEPLMTGSGEINGSGMTRRRGAAEEGSEPAKFKDSYNYVSSTTFSPPPDTNGGNNNNNQPMHSLTFGGFGPADPSTAEAMTDASKSKSLKLHTRALRGCASCLRTMGCSNHEMLSREGPDSDFYRDDFNDEPISCSIGTSEEDGIWMNRSDTPGTIMAFMVWFLLGYSALTVTFLAETGGIPGYLAMIYVMFCALALACHAKTQFTDPGTVPASAQPVEAIRRLNPDQPLAMCSQCQTFKPPYSHHCRICNRCISRMDHHCPWMNNCIGAGNFKHFILFLVYTWICTCMSLCLLGWNYFFCVSEECVFNVVLIQLARIVTVLSTGALLFTSSMVMNVTYGIMTGIGTIDRLKKKATDTMYLSEEQPIPLKDVFGIAGYHTWFLPIDPVFEDYDVVLGYSTPQRLLREQMKVKQPPSNSSFGGMGSGSVSTQGDKFHV